MCACVYVYVYRSADKLIYIFFNICYIHIQTHIHNCKCNIVWCLRYIHKCLLRRCYRCSFFSSQLYTYARMYIYVCTFVCCNRFYVCFARFNLENCSPYKLSMLLLPHCVVVLLLRMLLLVLLLLVFLFLRLFRTCCAPSRCKSGNFGNVVGEKYTHTLT